MPYKNHYFQEENTLLNIFYGTVTNIDIRNHAVELVNQTIMDDGYIKITDSTHIKDVNIDPAIIMNTASLRYSKNTVTNSESFLIRDNPQFNHIAEQVAKEWENQGDNVTVTTSLKHALETIGKSHLFEQFNDCINKYRLFGISQ